MVKPAKKTTRIPASLAAPLPTLKSEIDFDAIVIAPFALHPTDETLAFCREQIHAAEQECRRIRDLVRIYEARFHSWHAFYYQHAFEQAPFEGYSRAENQLREAQKLEARARSYRERWQLHFADAEEKIEQRERRQRAR